MSQAPEKRQATTVFPIVSVPITASQCIGLSFDEILKIHKQYHIAKPEKKNPDLMIEIRFSEATLMCLIREDVCVEAYLHTDDKY